MRDENASIKFNIHIPYMEEIKAKHPGASFELIFSCFCPEEQGNYFVEVKTEKGVIAEEFEAGGWERG